MSAHRHLKHASLLMASATLLMVNLHSANAAKTTAPVAGFAQSFLLGMQLGDAKITILETGEKFRTDKTGHFGPFQYPVGEPNHPAI